MRSLDACAAFSEVADGGGDRLLGRQLSQVDTACQRKPHRDAHTTAEHDLRLLAMGETYCIGNRTPTARSSKPSINRQLQDQFYMRLRGSRSLPR